MYFVLKIKSFIKDKNMGFVAKATNVSYLLSLLKIKNPYSSLQTNDFVSLCNFGNQVHMIFKKASTKYITILHDFHLNKYQQQFYIAHKIFFNPHYNIYMQKNPNEQGMNLDELVLHVFYQTQSANFVCMCTN